MKASLHHAWEIYTIVDTFLYKLAHDLASNDRDCVCDDPKMYPFPNEWTSGYTGICLKCGGKEAEWN